LKAAQMSVHYPLKATVAIPFYREPVFSYHVPLIVNNNLKLLN
jgi:hypothetical protein